MRATAIGLVAVVAGACGTAGPSTTRTPAPAAASASAAAPSLVVSSLESLRGRGMAAVGQGYASSRAQTLANSGTRGMGGTPCHPGVPWTPMA